MMSFSFTAPTLMEPEALFDPDAILKTSEVYYNTTRETLERLARIKKFVVWLKAEMEKAGIPTKKGLVLDGEGGGWFFDVAANEGSVMCVVSNLEGGGTRISLTVTEMGGAPEGVDQAVGALLKRSGEISELQVGAL